MSSGRFASPEDHLDLIVPEYPPDRLADLALAGAPEQLPEGSATLLAGAVDGWRAAFAAWLTVAQSLSGTLTVRLAWSPRLPPWRRRTADRGSPTSTFGHVCDPTGRH